MERASHYPRTAERTLYSARGVVAVRVRHYWRRDGEGGARAPVVMTTANTDHQQKTKKWKLNVGSPLPYCRHRPPRSEWTNGGHYPLLCILGAEGKTPPVPHIHPFSYPLHPVRRNARWWTERKYRLREFQEWRDEKSIWMYTLWPQNIHLDTMFNVK